MEPRVLTLEEQRWFSEVLSQDRLGTASLLDMATGLRRGELLAPRWQHVDLKEVVIRVSQELVRVKDPETGQSKLEYQPPQVGEGTAQHPPAGVGSERAQGPQGPPEPGEALAWRSLPGQRPDLRHRAWDAQSPATSTASFTSLGRRPGCRITSILMPCGTPTPPDCLRSANIPR